MISWPPWIRVWGWASYRFLSFTVFSLGLPFCFSSYIVHLRCTSEGVVSMFNETSLSLCGVVHECRLPCRVVVTAKWVVSCTRITCVQPLSRCSLTLHTSSFISGSVVVVFSLFPLFFSPCVLSFLSLVYWPFRTRSVLACLIRAAILYFSCRLHLFTSRCFLIGSSD